MILLRFRNFLLLISFLILHQSVWGQKFALQNVNYKKGKIIEPVSGFYDLSNDIKADRGAIENTRIIQQALNSHRRVLLPALDLIISKKGLTLNSNNELYFRGSSTLIMEPNNLERYELLRVHHVENVKIYNANLVGDRIKHRGNVGEWGHGISICGSRNVLIHNFNIGDFWGDGLYIGAFKNKPSSKITVEKGFSNNNRRNAISVTSVDGLIMKDIVVANSNGTKPMYGVCIEANSKLDEINNIIINGLRSVNNAEGGIMISFYKMAGKGNAVQKDVNIIVNNFEDRGSQTSGILVAQIPDNFRNLTGKIAFTNVVVEGNRRPIIIRTNAKKKFKISMTGVDIVRPLNKNFHNREFKRIHDNKTNISITLKENSRG